MLQQFIEFSLLIIGLYALFTGKLPLGWGSNSKIESRAARTVGILFIAPLPLLLCLGVFFNLIGIPLEKVIFIEPLTVLLIIIITTVIIQKARKPFDAMNVEMKEKE